jgi:hypothetical protein
MAVKIIFSDDSYCLRTLLDVSSVWRIFDIESQKTDTIIFFYDSTLWNSYTYSYGGKLFTEKYKNVTCQGYDEFIFSLEKQKKNTTNDFEKTIWTFEIDACSGTCSCEN